MIEHHSDLTSVHPVRERRGKRSEFPILRVAPYMLFSPMIRLRNSLWLLMLAACPWNGLRRRHRPIPLVNLGVIMNCINSLPAIVLTIASFTTPAIAHWTVAARQDFPQPYATAKSEAGDGSASIFLESPPAVFGPADAFLRLSSPFRNSTRHDAARSLIVAASRPTPPSGQSGSQSQGMSEEEARLRMLLLQRSQGFGGIFSPLMQGLKQGGGKGRSSGNDCGPYTDYAACQAYKAGDGWAADRLQNRRSNPSERDWYNR